MRSAPFPRGHHFLHFRSLLPPVTDHDIHTRPHDLRRTAYGWAWKCAHCGQFASSETRAGKYVCRAHGGVTARQRDPEAQQLTREHGQPLSRPPGRPMRSGFYSRRPSVRLDEIVEQYRQARLNLDCTDEDMLYLRAYQQKRMEQYPQLQDVNTQLRGLQTLLEPCLELTPEGALTWAGEHPEAATLLREARLLLRQTSAALKQMEQGHTRLIKLSKVRAETRVKNRAAEQVEAFTLMVQRLMVVLQEQLSPSDLAALQTRIARDLAEIPMRLVDGSQRIEQE